jgi:hypothetical protein
MDWTILFCFALGSCGTYLFCRNLGLGVEAAVAGAAAYSLSGFFVINNNNSFVRTYSYIPILLFAVDMAAKSPKARWVALLGSCIGATILAGMPEAAFFSLILAAVYAFYRIVAAEPRSRCLCLFEWKRRSFGSGSRCTITDTVSAVPAAVVQCPFSGAGMVLRLRKHC